MAERIMKVPADFSQQWAKALLATKHGDNSMQQTLADCRNEVIKKINPAPDERDGLERILPQAEGSLSEQDLESVVAGKFTIELLREDRRLHARLAKV